MYFLDHSMYVLRIFSTRWPRCSLDTLLESPCMCRLQWRGRNTNPGTRFYENYLKNAKKTSELDQLHFSQKLGINRKMFHQSLPSPRPSNISDLATSSPGAIVLALVFLGTCWWFFLRNSLFSYFIISLLIYFFTCTCTCLSCHLLLIAVLEFDTFFQIWVKNQSWRGIVLIFSV